MFIILNGNLCTWQQDGRGPLPPTRSVFFEDNTAGGELARCFQEAENEAGVVTGCMVRITESAGTPLGLLLPSTNPWGPHDCTRKDFVTCSQGDERRIDCRKHSILQVSVYCAMETRGIKRKGKECAGPQGWKGSLCRRVFQINL